MKKFHFSLLLLFALAAVALSSCKKDDDDGPKCKTCSAVQTVYLDDELMSTYTISGQEVCDDDLKQIEANPEYTVTQTVGDMTQKVIVVYTCE